MEQLPPGEQGEQGEAAHIQTFQFGPWLFNINRAQAILRAAPRETETAPVVALAHFYGLDAIDGGPGVSLFIPTHLDREYALQTDLDDPLIMATLSTEEGQPVRLLIDGLHRLYRAYTEGVAHLPAYRLDVDESLAIREDPFTTSPLHWLRYGEHWQTDDMPPEGHSDAE